MNTPADQFATRARFKKQGREWAHYMQLERERKVKFAPYDRLEKQMKDWR